MAPQWICDGRSEMTDAEVLRAALPASTMKMLARVTGRPIDTARTWLYRRFNPAQRRELAAALLAEMDRQDVRRDAARRRLAEWAAEP